MMKCLSLFFIILFSISSHALVTLEAHLGKQLKSIPVVVNQPPAYERGFYSAEIVNDELLYKYSPNEEISDDEATKNLDLYAEKIMREIGGLVKISWHEKGTFTAGNCGHFIKVKVTSGENNGWDTPYESDGYVLASSILDAKSILGNKYPQVSLDRYLKECEQVVGEKDQPEQDLNDGTTKAEMRKVEMPFEQDMTKSNNSKTQSK